MKTLLLNGSPHEKGSTYTALRVVADSLEAEGSETEIYQIPFKPILGCSGCRTCKKTMNNRCVVEGDAVNVIIEKMEGSDALVIGTPVYYAAPNGHLLAVLDRVFFPCGYEQGAFTGKPASAICVARRGGTTATLEVLQKYFTIAGMPIVPTSYWPMIHGLSGEEVLQDLEGVQAMQMVGKTLAWLMKCIAAGKSAGVAFPALPGGEKVWTSFIR